MANLYYHEDLSADAFRVGEVVHFAGDEAHHAVRVARLRVGEQILVGNGAGMMAAGEVIDADRSQFSVELREIRSEALSPHPIALVQALAKGDRDERAIEQVTEFGIDLIWPWQAERSVSRWDGVEKCEKGRLKWQRIAREASKQSLRPRVPAVLSLATTEALCDLAVAGAQVVVLHPGADRALSEYTRDVIAPFLHSPLATGVAAGDPIAGVFLVVGPEGGLSDAELLQLETAGAVQVRLGDTVLRTSSAGPAALAVIHAVTGRW